MREDAINIPQPVRTKFEVLPNAERQQIEHGYVRVPTLYVTWQVPFRFRARLFSGSVELATAADKDLGNLVIEPDGEAATDLLVETQEIAPGIVQVSRVAPEGDDYTDGTRVGFRAYWKRD